MKVSELFTKPYPLFCWVVFAVSLYVMTLATIVQVSKETIHARGGYNVQAWIAVSDGCFPFAMLEGDYKWEDNEYHSFRRCVDHNLFLELWRQNDD